MLRVRENRRELTSRIDVARIVVGAVFAVLASAYWYVQIVRGDHYFGLSENNRIRSVKLTAPRGYVLDRDGSVLVENEPAYSLLLYRREAKDLARSTDFVIRLLGIPAEQVRARIERGRRYAEFVPIPIAENLTLEEVAAVQARAPEHPEFAIGVSQRRLYKRGGSAAHVLGYLAEATPVQIRESKNAYRLGDWIGQKGIERTYEKLLGGTNGERRVVVDSNAREIREESRLESRPGQNLFLTVHRELQELAEECFAEQVGSAVALDPKTGEILALVSSPSYDPNWFTRRVTAGEWSGLMSDPNHPLQNRAIQNTYSPGSVFKVFLAYGALASGEVDPNATVYCPGQAVYYGRAFRCHRRGGHGSVNLRDAIKVSCDVYFYALGRRLGVDGIARIARAFGFGEPTGLDLAHEKPGLVPSEEWARTKRRARWYPSETISVAIGQGPVLVTPLQVARALAGLIEGGRLPTPHLFFASQDPRTGTRLRYEAQPKKSLELDPKRLAIVKSGMWAVLNEPGGTAFGSRVPGLAAAGKTGTVQVAGRNAVPRAGVDRRRLEDHAWFAAFAPMDDPKIVVVVFVEHGGHGSSAAAPIARLLLAKYFGLPIKLRAGEPGFVQAADRSAAAARPAGEVSP
ncbi:MAG TPA: penicillin-binding protein 2 [Thermoanaerobaculia bacterium]|nr:penicillin-binding protein 2 [Thermoanaerobaculia bacterium]